MSNWQNGVTALNENNMRALYDLRVGDTNIQANTDLNNLTTVGSYKCTSSSVLATLLNLPAGVSSTFKLIVENISSSTNYKQTMHVNGNYALTYIRSYGGSTWGDWKKVVTAGDDSWKEMTGESSGYTLKYKRTGDIVCLIGNCNIFNSIASLGYKHLFTLPETYRPISTISFIPVVLDDSAIQIDKMKLDINSTDGRILLSSTNSSTVSISQATFCITYAV